VGNRVCRRLGGPRGASGGPRRPRLTTRPTSSDRDASPGFRRVRRNRQYPPLAHSTSSVAFSPSAEIGSAPGRRHRRPAFSHSTNGPCSLFPPRRRDGDRIARRHSATVGSPAGHRLRVAAPRRLRAAGCTASRVAAFNRRSADPDRPKWRSRLLCNLGPEPDGRTLIDDQSAGLSSAADLP